MFRFIQSIFLILTLFIAYLTWLIASTPSVDKINKCITTKMYKVRLCEGSDSYAHLSQISSYAKHLIVIAEDASFFAHSGFDEDELKKSLATNISKKKMGRGGSTITQQLAKNVFLTFEKSIQRKIREALLAIQLEKVLTKNQILEKYLNVIEFGPNIYGIKKAAEFYFHKEPANLNLLESAYLIFLVPNPKSHSRSFSSQVLTPYARYRVLDLCYRMFRFRKITNEQYLAAKEYVDEFPWTHLTSAQENALSGVTYDSQVPPITDAGETNDNIESALPEQDESLSPVEPPVEDPVESPVEDAIAPTAPTEIPEPFEN